MTRHYPELDSASHWLYRVGNLIQPIRSTTQIWVMTRYQYGISALVSQMSFGGWGGGGTSDSVVKCRPSSLVNKDVDVVFLFDCVAEMRPYPNGALGAG